MNKPLYQQDIVLWSADQARALPNASAAGCCSSDCRGNGACSEECVADSLTLYRETPMMDLNQLAYSEEQVLGAWFPDPLLRPRTP